ncbi:hypothetical protein LCGC14_1846940 [marine sediment metagenome]|uniref:Uncharacterized protein n=1 Tax=marine sediment metagenome TaxID=412755 RepID=A0A0F9JAR4_9ZZZZ
MVGPLTHKIRNLEGQRDQYMQEARKDIQSRRAMHNSQLQSYEQDIKPLKRKARMESIQQNLASIGARVGKMGPM